MTGQRQLHRTVLQVSTHAIWWMLLGIIVTLTGAHGVSHVLAEVAPNRLTELLLEKFSFEGEANFPAFFSAVILLMVATLFATIAGCTRAIGEPDWRYWAALASVFCFLSLDEAAQIHEKLDTDMIWGSMETSGFLAWPWVILYGGIVTVFLLAFGRFWWRLPAGVRTAYAVSAALYVGAALGFEMLEANEATTGGSRESTTFYLLVTFEELLEMLAIAYCIRTSMRFLSAVVPTALVFAGPPMLPSSILRRSERRPAHAPADAPRT